MCNEVGLPSGTSHNQDGLLLQGKSFSSSGNGENIGRIVDEIRDGQGMPNSISTSLQEFHHRKIAKTQ
jgi:hypothetical protein